jgi:hypothetical protein
MKGAPHRPRLDQVLLLHNSRSRSGSDQLLIARACNAEEATWVCTPPIAETTATGLASGALRSCRPSLQPSTWSHVSEISGLGLAVAG